MQKWHEEITERVKRRMDGLKMKGKDLSVKLGIKEPALSRWFSDQFQGISLSNFLKLLSALKTTPKMFFLDAPFRGMDLQDLIAIKTAEHLFSLYFDEDENLWVATSMELNAQGLHYHGEDDHIPTAILKMEKQCEKYIETVT